MVYSIRMTKHNQFYRGILFALTAGLALDFLLVHQLFNHHHLYDGPSVNIVEPALAVVFIIIAVIALRREFKS